MVLAAAEATEKGMAVADVLSLVGKMRDRIIFLEYCHL
jgi:hypothetical protein